MMQDLPRSPNELMPEVTSLLPYFIENLGNSKVSIITTPIFNYISNQKHSAFLFFNTFLLRSFYAQRKPF